jgi:hypothetical protein
VLCRIVSGAVVDDLLLDGVAMGAAVTGFCVVATMNFGSTPKELDGLRDGGSDGIGSVGQYSTMTGAEVGVWVTAATCLFCHGWVCRSRMLQTRDSPSQIDDKVNETTKTKKEGSHGTIIVSRQK